MTKTLGQSAVVLVQLRQQKIVLEKKLATIKILDNQILDLLETEHDIDQEINGSSKFSEGICTTLLKIDDKLKQLDVTVSDSGNGNSAQPSQGGAEDYTKLPTKFYGKAHKRTEFWDSFKASVDTNLSLSHVLKLENLKTQCERG